jgi:endonuclease G, mitochondrial
MRQPVTGGNPDNDERLQMRHDLAEDRTRDPNGFERILGRSDLTSINFLERGRRAAAAVCRIKLPTDGGVAYGTGFLVGPRLLLTNHHVLASKAEAAQAEAEFGYEHDLDGVLAAPVQFNLRPHEIFFTSSELDITFVSVAPLSENSVPLERYGRLPLLPISGKAIPGEWVSIIQHPKGQPKQIAIQASEVIALKPGEVPQLNLDNFLHYTTDTEPGSSGSPVLNDQWQVAAIHHKAVPAPPSVRKHSKGRIEWIANEGVRISAIFRYLERRRFDDGDAGAVLDQLAGALGLPPAARVMTASDTTEQYAPFKAARWNDATLGYNSNFLSEPISLDAICAKARKKKLTAPLLDGSGDELTYRHFSVVLHEKRRFALITAVNIDGDGLTKVDRKDTWRLDSRVDAKYQPGDELYVTTKAKEKVYFSRGHQVRLLDPCWGSAAEAVQGMEDTFHFTNAAPQFQSYNNSDWGNLEDYILEKAQGTGKRLTVFTGPVFLKDDPLYGRKRKGGPWQIPLTFWKLAVLQKTDTTISAAAFIVGQTEYVQALYEAQVFTGLNPYTLAEMKERKIQLSIAALQKTLAAGSALDFSALKPYDAHGSLESTRQVQWLGSMNDISI